MDQNNNKVEEVEEVESGSYSKKDIFIYALIHASIFLLLPTVIGISLTAILKMRQIAEAMYVIFGTISILFALFRSRRRDSKNFRKNHTISEDKDTPEYKQFFYQQLIAYVFGLISIALSVPCFYICIAIGL